MTTKPSDFRKVWKQVPDQYIWRNAIDGVFVSVHGSTDQGWYVVRRMIPLPKDGGMGSVTTEDVSPYYVLRIRPTGMMGEQSNMRIRRNFPWVYGDFQDALNDAYDYMLDYKAKPRNI